MESNYVFTPGSRRPVTERIASWSVKYRKSVLLGWFLMVAGGGQAQAVGDLGRSVISRTQGS